MTTPFIEENDQTRTRREHLEKIRELIGNAYPNKFRRTNVAGSPEGEDTVSALVNRETLKRVVGDEAFARAFDALEAKVGAGEKPTPEDLGPVNASLNRIEVRTSGRLATPPRFMGKAAFVHLSDGKERLQIYVRRDDVSQMSTPGGSAVNGWELFRLLDHGDFVGVAGFLFVTRTGELSIHVRSFEFLAKALLPMPDKMHGVADPEIRQRQRYVDLIAGSLKVDLGDEPAEARARELSPREVFERRSRIIREMRRHLDEHGYVEVETPMLTPIASGAAARPFVTHHNALDIDLYARIAPELYLKRLLVGGFERVYELNRNFRNEGISTRHNPEFTMLEFYCAYMDVNGMMDFCEELLRTTVEKVTGGTTVRFGEHELDFGGKFERLTMKQAVTAQLVNPQFSEMLGETFDPGWLDDPYRTRALAVYFEKWATVRDSAPTRKGVFISSQELGTYLGRLHDAAKSLWQESVSSARAAGGIDETQIARDIASIFEEVAEQKLNQPTFITDFPKPISPLSKASPENPAFAERFELYVMGMECANGFSELNDPVEQYERFEEQMRQRERGDDEAMQMDVDYVKALSYGMPPAAGIGIGVDRLVMLLTNRRSIRDVILFPHMRPRRAAEGGEQAAGEAGQEVKTEEEG